MASELSCFQSKDPVMASESSCFQSKDPAVALESSCCQPKDPAMASESSCCQPKEEQLYMLELLVDRLNLSPEKIREIASTPLTVRLEFLDFHPFEINEDEFWSSKKRNEKQKSLSSERKSGDGTLDFSAGKSCLFPKRPNELVDAMRLQPLKIGVYKTAVKKICSVEKNETAVCKSEVPLSGCLCDQVAMSMNDANHLPKPYTFRNTWNLIDEEGKPSGTILLFLRLTCLGKSIVTQFAVKNESFLFKSSNSSNEFQCSRVPLDDEEKKKHAIETIDKICQPDGYRQPEVNPSPKPQSVIGLAPICQELVKRDGGPLEVVPPLELSTHRIVEEISSRNIEIIQTRIINEDPECVCRSGCASCQRTTPKFPCGRGHCSGGLCAGKKITESFDTPHPCYSMTNRCNTGSCCSKNLPTYCYKPRMRGGGRSSEETSGMIGIVDADRPNDCRRNVRQDKIPPQSIENLISGACRPSGNKSTSSRKPGCCCFGKSGTGAMGIKLSFSKNDFSCSNEPCHGVDCLIRAFKETQQFVDSIGKVPGLAGLGLMDPTESPYFGRERDDALTSCEPKISGFLTTKRHSPDNHPLIQHTGKRGSNGKRSSSFAPPQALVSNLYHNVNQLEHSTMLERTKKKTDEKSEKQKELHESPGNQPTIETESPPCGQPKCKSIKKKSPEEVAATTPAEMKSSEATKKLAIGSKSSDSRKSRSRGRVKSPLLPGPAGDRLSRHSHRNSRIKVSKRIMRLVNAIRDRRFCHGHKNCIDVRVRVPGNMGWLWNTTEVLGPLKPLIGWKPGAISKYVWERMQQAKARCTETGSTSESRPASPPSKGKRSKAHRSKSFHSLGRSHWAKNRLHDKDDHEVELPPTLHIHRKDGTYYVTMYPVKVETNEETKETEEKPKPLQFKVTKNKDEEGADTSSTGSDMEIEFSPPAALNRYRKKIPVKHQDTQVNQQEIIDTFKVPSVKRSNDGKTKKAKKKK